MKTIRRFFAVFLAVLLISASIPYALTADNKLTLNEDGTFRIMQLSDIQQSSSRIHEKSFSAIKLAVAEYKPDLIVMTGDNIVSAAKTQYFDDAVKKITQLFVDKNGNKIPFAVTYGNHDYEYNTLDNEHSLEKQNEIYLKYGAIDFDDKTISDIGTGYIDIYTRDGSKVAQRVILINSGTYAKDGGYGKAGYNQVSKEDKALGDNEERYNRIVSAVDTWTDAGYPTIAFQHIPLREFYVGDSPSQQILVKDENGKGYNYYTENGKSYRWAASKENPTVNGIFSTSCACSCTDTFDLYKALAKENVAGIYYGHDHLNTLTGTSTITRDGVSYTLNQGYGGGMLVYTGTYLSKANTDNNPLTSIYTFSDGKVSKETVGYNDLIKTIDNSSYKGTYVSDIRLFSGNDFSEACNNAIANKYIPLKKSINKNTNADLNLNSDGKSVVLGYRKTTDVTKALTDIRVLRIVKDSESINTPDDVPATYTQNFGKATVTYTVENPVSPTDANLGVNKSDNTHTSLYLYKTCDKQAGMPIKSLFETSDSSAAVYYKQAMLPYARITYFGPGECADLLNGTGVSTYIYVYSTYGDYIEKCSSHYDTDGDGRCDICLSKINEEAKPDTAHCSCMCHKGGFYGFIWKIMVFFYRIFGTNRICECSVKHY